MKVHILLSKTNIFRLISVITAFCFFCNSVLYGAPLVESGKFLLNKQEIITNSPKIEDLFIPESFGSITKKFNTENENLIIHIQDAHCNYEAQQNISKILEILVRDYKVDLVAVEGAAGDIDLKRFGKLEDNKAKERVTDIFVKKGIVTGPEYLKITKYNDLPFGIYGIENGELYVKNFLSFRNTISNKKDTQFFIDELNKVVCRLKEKIYSKELLGLDNNIQLFNDNKTSLTDYIKYLSKTENINREKYPNINTILRSIRIEEGIDFKRVEKEREQLIRYIEKSLPKEELKNLVKNSLQYKLGKISALDYYSYLEKYITGDEVFSLRRYIQLIKLQSRIDSNHLFKEIYSLEKEIKNRLFKSRIESQIDDLSEKTGILNKLFNLQLNRETLQYFKDHKSEFSTDSLISLIRIQAPLNNIQLHPIFNDTDFLKRIDEYIVPGDRFYEEAVLRDSALVENTLEKMESENRNTAVMITGGFHTDGITGILKQKNIAHIVIAPKITKVQEDCPYLSLMMDERIKAQAADNKKQNVAFVEMLGEGEEHIATIIKPLDMGKWRALLQEDIVRQYLSKGKGKEQLAGAGLSNNDVKLLQEIRAEIEKAGNAATAIRVLDMIIKVSTGASGEESLDGERDQDSLINNIFTLGPAIQGVFRQRGYVSSSGLYYTKIRVDDVILKDGAIHSISYQIDDEGVIAVFIDEKDVEYMGEDALEGLLGTTVNSVSIDTEQLRQLIDDVGNRKPATKEEAIRFFSVRFEIKIEDVKKLIESEYIRRIASREMRFGEPYFYPKDARVTEDEYDTLYEEIADIIRGIDIDIEVAVSKAVELLESLETLPSEGPKGGRALRHNLTNRDANEIIRSAKEHEDVEGIENIKSKLTSEEWENFRRVCELAGIPLTDDNVKLIVVDTDDSRFEAHYGNARMTGGRAVRVFIKKRLLEMKGAGLTLAHEFLEGHKLRILIRAKMQRGEMFLDTYSRLEKSKEMAQLEDEAHRLVIAQIDEARSTVERGKSLFGKIMQGYTQPLPASMKPTPTQVTAPVSHPREPVREIKAAVVAREIIGKILEISHDFNRWQEKYKIQKQLVSLGREIIPLLIDILRNSRNEDEKKIALDAIAQIGDERAMDILVDVLSNNPDSNRLGQIAAYGLGRIGKTAIPRVKALLSTHGPKRNILFAIERLKDESFIPLLRSLQADDNDTKRLIGHALLTLGDKSGLVTLIDLFESAVKDYEETEGESVLTFIGTLLGDLSMSDAKDKAKAMLKTDSFLEGRIAIAAKTMIDSVKGEFLTQRLIELFGLGTSDAIAKILWELFVSIGGNETLGRAIVLAMKEVGPVCIPYLTQGDISNDLIYEILGDMGDASAIPFLLGELRETEYSDYNRGRLISKAVKKIGGKALPYLLEALENEMEDNNYICRLLVSIQSSNAIPKMIGVLKTDISEENKLNIIQALGEMELYGNHLSTALRQYPILRKTLFDLTIDSLKDGLDGIAYLAIETILKATATNGDVPKLINIYQQNRVGVKKVILEALSSARTDDETIAFLISVLSSPNREIVQVSLKTIDSLAKTGNLIEYLKRNDDKREELIGLLEAKAQASTFAISILGIIGSERCLAILIKELDRKIQQNIGIDTTLLEALMTIGDRARVILLSHHSDLIATIDRIITKYLLTPHSFDISEESAKDIVARTFKQWLIFIGGKGAVKRPTTRQELVETYFSQREEITNLIIKMKEYLARNPDMTYEEIMKFMEEDIRGLSVRAKARFRIGVINYVMDRERVRKIIGEAAKAGIKDGDSLTATDLQKNRKKAQFVTDMLEFLPESVQILFLADTIHIILDSESYGRMRYRQKTHVMDAADGYNKLLPQERFAYQDSGGVFSSYQRSKVGEVILSGLLTFEILPFYGTSDGHILVHEVQHRFFHGYAEDELREALLSRRHEASRLVEEINAQTGDERGRSIENLIDTVVMVLLYDYQNEMISRIIDGKWIEDKDISGWFEFYKEWYMDNVRDIVNKISDEQLRQNMLERIFGKAEEILKKYKPIIKKIIELKAQLIEREGRVDYKLALERANAWVATFFQTIPVIRFDRLNWLVSRLSAELEKGIEAKQGGRALRHNLTNRDANEIIRSAKEHEDVEGIENIKSKLTSEEWENFRRVCELAGIPLTDDNVKLIVVDTDDSRFEAHYGNARMTGGRAVRVFIKKRLLEMKGAGLTLAHEFLEGNKLRELIMSRVQREGETFLQAYLRIDGTEEMNQLENEAHEWTKDFILWNRRLTSNEIFAYSGENGERCAEKGRLGDAAPVCYTKDALGVLDNEYEYLTKNPGAMSSDDLRLIKDARDDIVGYKRNNKFKKYRGRVWSSDDYFIGAEYCISTRFYGYICRLKELGSGKEDLLLLQYYLFVALLGRMHGNINDKSRNALRILGALFKSNLPEKSQINLGNAFRNYIDEQVKFRKFARDLNASQKHHPEIKAGTAKDFQVVNVYLWTHGGGFGNIGTLYTLVKNLLKQPMMKNKKVNIVLPEGAWVRGSYSYASPTSIVKVIKVMQKIPDVNVTYIRDAGEAERADVSIFVGSHEDWGNIGNIGEAIKEGAGMYVDDGSKVKFIVPIYEADTNEYSQSVDRFTGEGFYMLPTGFYEDYCDKDKSARGIHLDPDLTQKSKEVQEMSKERIVEERVRLLKELNLPKEQDVAEGAWGTAYYQKEASWNQYIDALKRAIASHPEAFDTNITIFQIAGSVIKEKPVSFEEEISGVRLRVISIDFLDIEIFKMLLLYTGRIGGIQGLVSFPNLVTGNASLSQAIAANKIFVHDGYYYSEDEQNPLLMHLIKKFAQVCGGTFNPKSVMDLSSMEFNSFNLERLFFDSKNASGIFGRFAVPVYEEYDFGKNLTEFIGNVAKRIDFSGKTEQRILEEKKLEFARGELGGMTIGPFYRDIKEFLVDLRGDIINGDYTQYADIGRVGEYSIKFPTYNKTEEPKENNPIYILRNFYLSQPGVDKGEALVGFFNELMGYFSKEIRDLDIERIEEEPGSETIQIDPEIKHDYRPIIESLLNGENRELVFKMAKLDPDQNDIRIKEVNFGGSGTIKYVLQLVLEVNGKPVSVGIRLICAKGNPKIMECAKKEVALFKALNELDGVAIEIYDAIAYDEKRDGEYLLDEQTQLAFISAGISGFTVGEYVPVEPGAKSPDNPTGISPLLYRSLASTVGRTWVLTFLGLSDKEEDELTLLGLSGREAHLQKGLLMGDLKPENFVNNTRGATSYKEAVLSIDLGVMQWASLGTMITRLFNFINTMSKSKISDEENSITINIMHGIADGMNRAFLYAKGYVNLKNLNALRSEVRKLIKIYEEQPETEEAELSSNIKCILREIYQQIGYKIKELEPAEKGAARGGVTMRDGEESPDKAAERDSWESAVRDFADMLGLDYAEVTELINMNETDNAELVHKLIGLIKAEGREISEEDVRVVVENAEKVDRILMGLKEKLEAKGKILPKNLETASGRIAAYLAIKELTKERELPGFLKLLSDGLKAKKIVSDEIIDELTEDIFRTDAFYIEDGRIYSSRFYDLYLQEIKERFGIKEGDDNGKLLRQLVEYKFRQTYIQNVLKLSSVETANTAEILEAAMDRNFQKVIGEMKLVNLLARFMVEEEYLLNSVTDQARREKIRKNIKDYLGKKGLTNINWQEEMGKTLQEDIGRISTINGLPGVLDVDSPVAEHLGKQQILFEKAEDGEKILSALSSCKRQQEQFERNLSGILASLEETADKLTNRVYLQDVSSYIGEVEDRGQGRYAVQDFGAVSVEMIRMLQKKGIEQMFAYETEEEIGAFKGYLDTCGIRYGAEHKITFIKKSEKAYLAVKSEIEAKNKILVSMGNEKSKSYFIGEGLKDRVVIGDDLILLTRVALLVGTLDDLNMITLETAFAQVMKTILKEYYRGSRSDDDISNDIRKMITEGIWFILPPISPFVKTYYNALKESRELVLKAA